MPNNNKDSMRRLYIFLHHQFLCLLQATSEEKFERDKGREDGVQTRFCTESSAF